jgi:pimeloyl-ACP methyl ester carboxylesterase
MSTRRRALALTAALGLVAAGVVAGGLRHHASPAPSTRPTSRAGSFASRLLRFSPEAARIAAEARTSSAGRSAPQTRLAGTPCGETTGLLCSRIEVPLDRTGKVPGTVSLAVQVLPPATTTTRGAMFLIAGGPGQGSAHVFGLGSPSTVALYRYMFPGYTLVAYDDRGTGESGLIDCPALQASGSIEDQGGFVSACAGGIGPGREFYSTRDHAADLEAVRQALGVDKVALWGTSYGTKLALEYALAYPTHVERLLLDSVLPPELPDPYEANVLTRMPSTLSAFCGSDVCRGATSDLAGDVVAVANRLAARPVDVGLLQPDGRTHDQRVSGLGVLSTVVDADLSPGLAAALPAAVHAARQGSLRPLARLVALDSASNVVPAEELSSGLYAATTCRDGPFPWGAATPPAERAALLDVAIRSLPTGSLGPFGSWSARLGNAAFCLDWPAPSGGTALPSGPLPDVPVLAVSGGFDMRTPSPDAGDVVGRFRQGRLLVVPGVGHSVLGADASFCSQRAVRDWILGGAPVTSCARPPLFVRTVPAYPAAGAGVPSPATTLTAVSQALRDAEAIWFTTSGGDQIAGVYGGKLLAGDRGFTLVRYSTTRGIEVSGKLRISGSDLPLRFEGAVTVGGSKAAGGLLGVSPAKLAGTLDGRIVGG